MSLECPVDAHLSNRISLRLEEADRRLIPYADKAHNLEPVNPPMPPDIRGSVQKFIPNNSALAGVVVQVLKSVFQVPTLPLPLVKTIVERALEQSRTMEVKVDSSIFVDKLTIYANQLRPRYLAQINEVRKRGQKW